MSYLVTGAAGFIGFHTALTLLQRGDEVVGVDNLNDYYSIKLKSDRLTELQKHSGFRFHKIDLAEPTELKDTLRPYPIRRVVHLAAQAGVRHSIENPESYIRSNLVGHFNVLEYCRHLDSFEHLAYASSSSVYGKSASVPSKETDRVDAPISLYAATKKCDELMSHSYAHLYRMPQTGLRFFTVYGPWGRPDMALWLFTDAILSGRPINVFNHGKMRRDFTYIDDLIPAVIATVDKAPPVTESDTPHRIYNIGGDHTENLMDLIGVLEQALGMKAELNFLPMQAGDVAETGADVDAIRRDIGYQPTTRIETGVSRFVEWYKGYHAIS
jgi:UDP-glucuronate 4-epimerase